MRLEDKINQSLISVIVPVYNVEKYLCECLDSVLNQTYRGLQIIIVDDGSTDDSGNICDRYLHTDDRIEVYHTANCGLAAARNEGLEHVRGEYVCFVDSDDTLKPEILETLYLLMKENDADISGCRFYRNRGDKMIYPKENPAYDRIFTPQEFLVSFYNDFGTYAPAWGKLYKADLLKNMRYPENSSVEDAPMIRPLILQCKKIAWCQEPLYFYRKRENSLSQKVKRLEDICSWFTNDINCYKEASMEMLVATAYRAFCFKLCECRESVRKQEKDEFIHLYRSALDGMRKYKGNSVLQILKYSLIYVEYRVFDKIIFR